MTYLILAVRNAAAAPIEVILSLATRFTSPSSLARARATEG